MESERCTAVTGEDFPDGFVCERLTFRIWHGALPFVKESQGEAQRPRTRPNSQSSLSFTAPDCGIEVHRNVTHFVFRNREQSLISGGGTPQQGEQTSMTTPGRCGSSSISKNFFRCSVRSLNTQVSLELTIGCREDSMYSLRVSLRRSGNPDGLNWFSPSRAGLASDSSVWCRTTETSTTELSAAD